MPVLLSLYSPLLEAHWSVFLPDGLLINLWCAGKFCVLVQFHGQQRPSLSFLATCFFNFYRALLLEKHVTQKERLTMRKVGLCNDFLAINHVGKGRPPTATIKLGITGEDLHSTDNAAVFSVIVEFDVFT